MLTGCLVSVRSMGEQLGTTCILYAFHHVEKRCCRITFAYFCTHDCTGARIPMHVSFFDSFNMESLKYDFENIFEYNYETGT
jgi:hypothetical protein